MSKVIEQKKLIRREVMKVLRRWQDETDTHAERSADEIADEIMALIESQEAS